MNWLCVFAGNAPHSLHTIKLIRLIDYIFAEYIINTTLKHLLGNTALICYSGVFGFRSLNQTAAESTTVNVQTVEASTPEETKDVTYYRATIILNQRFSN